MQKRLKFIQLRFEHLFGEWHGAASVAACPSFSSKPGAPLRRAAQVAGITRLFLTEFTAHPGGGLLGDLLCAVGNLLNGGLTLEQILLGQGLSDSVTGALTLTSDGKPYRNIHVARGSSDSGIAC